MMSGAIAITPSRLVVWFPLMPASSAAFRPPAAVITPPSVDPPPATQSVSEYCVRASTRGFGSFALVTPTRAS